MNRLALTASAAAVALSMGASIAHADTINLRIGSGHPIGLLAYTESAHEFFAPELKRRIEERTDYTVNVQELHAGAVARVDQVLEATGDGILDIGFVSLIFEPSNAFLQNFTLFLPFGSPDPEMVTEAARATLDAHPELITMFEEQFNQKYLTGACLSNYGLGTDFEWDAFADLQGRRIAGAGVNLDWIAGASPVTSNLNEAYQSIQTGVYDGYISAISWWDSFKLYEVAPHFTLTDFGAQYLNAVTINLDTWDRLPPEVQEILVELAEDYEAETTRLCIESEAGGIAALEGHGATVRQISPEAREAWATALKDFPARMAAEADGMGLPGASVLETYMSELEKRGYVWPYRYELN